MACCSHLRTCTIPALCTLYKPYLFATSVMLSLLPQKAPLDEITERQKKLLSPDSEHSLAKIVAEVSTVTA